MTLFIPDDFSGRPYGGGTNQMGHVVFGAALSGAGIMLFGAFWAMVIIPLGVALFELWQRAYRGATLLDMKMDLAYWMTGGISWGLIVSYAGLPWFVAMWPWVPCMAFVVEYVRIDHG